MFRYVTMCYVMLCCALMVMCSVVLCRTMFYKALLKQPSYMNTDGKGEGMGTVFHSFARVG